MLDFEKAYDKVDWDFLEVVLSRLGFPFAWIKGVSTLYMHASSSVLFAGGYGPLFPISRSVRQGCPLAPLTDVTGASLNRNKSIRLWVGEETHPAWYPSSSFQWLYHGEPVQYLGCMVGIDLRPEAMLSPLLLSIKRKLLHWDAQ